MSDPLREASLRTLQAARDVLSYALEAHYAGENADEPISKLWDAIADFAEEREKCRALPNKSGLKRYFDPVLIRGDLEGGEPNRE